MNPAPSAKAPTEFPAKNASHKEIHDLIRARYPLLYVVSSEESRVQDHLLQVAKDRKRELHVWSITDGMRMIYAPDAPTTANTAKNVQTDSTDPLKALNVVSRHERDALFVLCDYHPYLASPEVMRKLRDLYNNLQYQERQKNVILLSPVLKLPAELEKSITVVDYNLPNRNEIGEILDEVLRDSGPNYHGRIKNDGELRERVIECALGLTAEEIKLVYSKTLVTKKEFDVPTINLEKKQIIRKSGILEYYETETGFGDVGGLEVLRTWLEKRNRAFSEEAREFGLPNPKGILMIGIPGCGKSLCAKATSALWELPLLRLDVGKVMGGLVGSSEENMRNAIKTAESVAPCILWLDELEKGFSGTASSGQTDGGTTARVFGTFITWLQEKTSEVFVVATANDVSQLPPELLRKGRFDEIFFVDLPSPEEREAIIRIHIEKRKRKPEEFSLAELTAHTQGFSGSEIEQAVISGMFDAFDKKVELDQPALLKACQEIIPLSQTMKEKIDFLRNWARSRARPASLNQTPEAPATKSRKLEME